MSTTSEFIDVEVFRAGSYPQGEFTERDLEQMAAAYDPAIHEAPVTLDHARGGPALGWVAGLARVGDRLVARLRAVSDTLRELVRSGAYRKPSAEIYLDFAGSGRKYLRAVTFLGAAVPEVKGLSEARFDEQGGSYATVACSPGRRSLAGDLRPGVAELIGRRLKGLLRLLEAKETEAKEAEAQASAGTPAEPSAAFAEKLARAKEEARREMEGELASERQRLERERRAHEVAVFCEGLCAEGRLLPCWSPGLAAFIEHLEHLEHLEHVEGRGAQGGVAFFAEAGLSPAAWFRGWLSGLPRMVEFAEVAPQGANDEAAVDAATRLQELALERMREEPALTFGEAFRAVCAAHPTLAAEYLSEVS